MTISRMLARTALTTLMTSIRLSQKAYEVSGLCRKQYDFTMKLISKVLPSVPVREYETAVRDYQTQLDLQEQLLQAMIDGDEGATRAAYQALTASRLEQLDAVAGPMLKDMSAIAERVAKVAAEAATALRQVDVISDDVFPRRSVRNSAALIDAVFDSN